MKLTFTKETTNINQLDEYTARIDGKEVARMTRLTVKGGNRFLFSPVVHALPLTGVAGKVATPFTTVKAAKRGLTRLLRGKAMLEGNPPVNVWWY